MSFSGVVVETAMNVTFPTLMAEFGVGTSTVQWITTGYLLVLACIIPTSSFLKRRFPMRELFGTAAGLFVLGTAMAAAAPAFWVLLAGRIVQGVGTGIALPLMFNIVMEQAPSSHIGLMMGVASLVTSSAPAVGPAVGGLIVSALGWRMIFVALLPLLVAALVAGVASIRQVTPVGRTPFQALDYALLAAGFACFIFATSTASEAGWLSAPVIGLLVACAALLVAFFRRSLSSESPLIDVRVFRRPSFSLSVAVMVLIQFLCLGLGFLIPNYAQIVLGEDAFTSGCLLLPGCVAGALLAPVSGRILDRLGAARPILVGNALAIASCVLFSVFSYRLTLPLFVWFYLLLGFGQGNTIGNTLTNGLRQLPPELQADGNAVLNTMQQLAGAIGTSIITTVVASAQAGYPDDLVTGTLVGTQSAFVVLAVLAVVMICCSLGVFATSRRARP